MNTGKKLEALIKESAEYLEWDYTRLKDAGWQGEKTQRRFTVKNVCDCILFIAPKIYFIEAKSAKSSITLDRLTQQKDLIKKHNPDKLIQAGYICQIKGLWFYLSAINAEDMQNDIGKKSFNCDDAMQYGRQLPGFTPTGKRKQRIALNYLP